jgi:hypothetical protein
MSSILRQLYGEFTGRATERFIRDALEFFLYRAAALLAVAMCARLEPYLPSTVQTVRDLPHVPTWVGLSLLIFAAGLLSIATINRLAVTRRFRATENRLSLKIVDCQVLADVHQPWYNHLTPLSNAACASKPFGLLLCGSTWHELKKALRYHVHAHASGSALHRPHGGVQTEAVQVRHLDLGDLFHLLLGDLAHLILIRLG